MKIEIKNYYSNEVIFTHECENNSILLTLKEAIKSGANLSEANLSGANLSGANLSEDNLSEDIYIDNLPIIKTLFLTGSRNTVFWLGRNWIKIGCIQKSIEEWETEYKEIGKQQNYSEDQINEYYQYIQICKQLQATL